MKKSKILLSVFCAVFVFGLVGCAQQPKSASSQDAIQQAKNLKTVEEQVKYLVNEANAFVSSEKFDEAIRISKYVLSALDKDSLDAKNVLEKAQVKLKAFAEKKAAETKQGLKDKLGNL